MEVFNPIWQQVTLTVENLAAIASEDVVLSPHSSLGDVNHEQIKFLIPTFQRGLRWKEAKREEFLSSLMEGLPIGSLVFARKSDSQHLEIKVNNWVVLDGQQRIAALRILYTTFWKNGRYRISNFSTELRLLAKTFLEDDTEDSVKLIIDQLQSTLKLVTKSDTSLVDDSRKLLVAFVQSAQFPYPNNPVEREQEIVDALTTIRKSALAQYEALRNYPVPVLLVVPRRSDSLEEQQNVLAQVFTALNSYTPLSKYELIAAQWATQLVVWPPNTQKHVFEWLETKARDRISDTYQLAIEEYEYDPNFEETVNIGLFGVLYALSQSTSCEIHPKNKEVPRKVLSLSKTAKSDIAFEVIGLFLLKKKPTDLEKIPSKIPLGEQNSLVVTDLIEAYIDASNQLETALTGIAGHPKYLNEKPLGLIQAIVYLTNLMAIHRQPNFKKAEDKLGLENEGEISRGTAVKRWKDNVSAWWLYDTLSDTFQGADANTNAVRRVWNSDGKVVLDMCSQPRLQDFAKAFESTFIEESGQLLQAPKRRSQSDKARAIMFAAYMAEHLTNQGEADHVIPWKRKGAKAPAPTNPLPLNHVANWMPLEKNINSSRSNTPWSDYVPTMSVTDMKPIKRRLLLPAENFTATNAYSVGNFLTLMLRRYQILVHRCLINLEVAGYCDLSLGDQFAWLEKFIREPIFKDLGDKVEWDESLTKIEVSYLPEQ
jgi:hypothetical protein